VNLYPAKNQQYMLSVGNGIGPGDEAARELPRPRDGEQGLRLVSGYFAEDEVVGNW
jgi:hypothetical protein